MIPTATRSMANCPAPAKLNLFLHVTGRRADGYHLLQTVFQLLDHGDVLHFSVRDDGIVHRVSMLEGVDENDDLTVRAARLLQASFTARTGRPAPGADIDVEKYLPLGGGLGGGSSDAATTLLVLNHLWHAGFSRADLMALGLQLGADVPFFLFGQNAFAEGVGEQLQAIETPAFWYVVIEPGVMVPTAAIFGAPHLTRNTKPVRIADFSRVPVGFGKNDLQEVAVAQHSAIAEAIAWLAQFGNARMTGSGACVFCAFANEQEADAALAATLARVLAQTTAGESGQMGSWKAWKAEALTQHPLAYLLQS
jgi:4-diphosphocytidyl-2-C-methyl-D-erythritol kinase